MFTPCKGQRRGLGQYVTVHLGMEGGIQFRRYSGRSEGVCIQLTQCENFLLTADPHHFGQPSSCLKTTDGFQGLVGRLKLLESASTLRDGSVEQAPGQGRSHKLANRMAASGLSEDGDVVWVSPEAFNIVAYPL